MSGVSFDLRDPMSRAEAMTTTTMAEFVDHGLEKPAKEGGTQNKTNFFMTDPGLKDKADFHKKTTYGENYAPRCVCVLCVYVCMYVRMCACM